MCNSPVTEGEKESDNNRTGIMFDRLMLMELRDNVNKLDTTAYAELKSYKEPPEVVHLILKSVLAIFHHSLALEGYFDNWNQCKQVRHYSKQICTQHLNNKCMYF